MPERAEEGESVTQPPIATHRFAVFFLLGTVVVLGLMYIPILRVHQGWEDEIFWFSTCLSMLRHQSPTPSVLADFPQTHTPLRFYGPTLFWLGALTLKIFGVTARVWRTFTFGGVVAFLAAVAVLFRKLCGSWQAGAAAAFLFSLSLNLTFWFSLPGRVDGWTLALIVSALAVAASHVGYAQELSKGFALRWSMFGVLLGLAASTTPRCWPLLFSMIALLPLLNGTHRVRVVLFTCAGGLATMALLFLPLHTTPWGHVGYVRRASANDSINIAPLMGGSLGYGHATTQIAYCFSLLVLLGLLYLPDWRRQERFGRWLLLAGLLNVLGMTLLLSGALVTLTFWTFPLEIVAILGLMRPSHTWNVRSARVLGAVLLVFMTLLRTARELPAFMHWSQRNPGNTQRAIAAAIPAGSIVYGPVGQYFYPVLQDGADYRYLVERTTPGLSSVPGHLDTPAPMADACDRPAYLIQPTGDESEPRPQFSHAALDKIAEQRVTPQSAGSIERMVERLPAGTSDPDQEAFSVYRLTLDRQYCAQLRRAPGSR